MNAFQGQVAECVRRTPNTCKEHDTTFSFNKPNRLTTVVYLATLLRIMIMLRLW